MLSRETKDSKCRALFPASRRHRSRRPPADYFVRKNAVISWSIRHAPAGPGASQRELQRRCIKRRVLLQEEFAGTRLRLGMTLKKHPDGVRHGLVERRYGECRKPVAATFNLVKTQLLATGALRLDSGHGCLLPALAHRRNRFAVQSVAPILQDHLPAGDLVISPSEATDRSNLFHLALKDDYRRTSRRGCFPRINTCDR